MISITKIVLITILALSTLHASKSYAKLSSNLKGDFLISPLYIAKDNICSKIKVMNTNEYSSILAKIAIRESIASHEVDFPLLLSPGDVWEGNICNRNGKVILTSSDDSNHPSALTMMINGIDLLGHSAATSYRENEYNKGYVELNGKSFELEEMQKTNMDFSHGYIEVYPIAQFNEGAKVKVNKKILLQRWERLLDGDTSNPKLRKNGVDEESLSGLISFNTSDQETATLPMKAFKYTHNYQRTGDLIHFTSDSNPELLLGKENKTKILQLLQSEQTSLLYDNQGKDQYIYFTFPFSYKEKQSRKYKLIIRDMNENKFVMVFSPIYIMRNEVACISIEELINLTKNTMKFSKGIIQIQDISNNGKVQLGKNKSPSMIPVKTRIVTIADRNMVVTSHYTPTKKNK